jgi:hypothetical protein
MNRPLRCRVGAHAWTLANGLDDLAPVYSSVECKRCDAEMERLPYAWIDAGVPRACLAGHLLGPRWIVLAAVILFTVFYPILSALVSVFTELTGAIL